MGTGGDRGDREDRGDRKGQTGTGWDTQGQDGDISGDILRGIPGDIPVTSPCPPCDCATLGDIVGATVFPQRVHLDIQVGEHTNNYPEIAANDKLTELQLRARQLLDQVEQIQKEQNYQRVRDGPWGKFVGFGGICGGFG